MKTILVSAITAALVVVSLLAFNAYAGRSAGGTYTLASPGVPFQSGQVISSTQMNNTFNDIATTLTNSLDRSGNGGMLAALRGIDGTQAAPAFSWTGETNSGLFRAGTGDVRMSVTNGLRQQWTTTGSAVTGTLSATGDVTASARLGVGAAPTDQFNVTVGAGNNVAAGFYIPTMADGTFDALLIGKSTGTSLSGQLTYTKNATVANSTWCMGLWGSQSTLCVDGGGKTTIGSNGTPIASSIRGTQAVGGGAILAQACTTQAITVTGAVAGAECAVGYPNLNPSGLVSYCQVAANSCQVITCNATSGSLSAVANTLSCRVFNP
jgi:hypothetical protein